MAKFESEFWQKMKTLELDKEIFAGRYGVEIEEHRVTDAGRLSQLPYPESLGDRRYHPYLQTDYSETQHELVTAPGLSFAEARDNLMRLQLVLRDHLRDGESIWPLSMPPRLVDDDLDWVDDTFGRPWMQAYRDWLKAKYGSIHEIITGLHVNFSLSEELIKGLFEAADETDYVAFKNELYFNVAQGVVAHRWLFVYLFGATPFNLNAADSRIPELDHPVRSIRGSQFGFANDADVVIGYDSNLDEHLAQVEYAVASQALYSNHEFYGAVRFKGAEDSTALRTTGVQYLEMRILDTDPFDYAGISENALNVIDLVIGYIIASHKTYTPAELKEHADLANQIAVQAPTEALPNFAEAKGLMAELSQFADEFGMRFNDGLSQLAERILEPSKTPAGKLVALAGDADAVQVWGTKIARERQEMFHVEHDALMSEFFPYGELAQTLAEAVALGVEVDLHTSQGLILRVDDHEETLSEPVNVRELFPELMAEG
jgi:glutamate--cysteine ligase